MSGVVFHHISEGIMAQDLKLDVKDAKDSTSILLPDVKPGNIIAADYVLNHLGFPTNSEWSGSYSKGNPIWGSVEINGHKTIRLKRNKVYRRQYVPNVEGMGAKDAVYILENRGVKVRLSGRGKVVKQSLEPGHYIQKGDICKLTLES